MLQHNPVVCFRNREKWPFHTTQWALGSVPPCRRPLPLGSIATNMIYWVGDRTFELFNPDGTRGRNTSSVLQILRMQCGSLEGYEKAFIVVLGSCRSIAQAFISVRYVINLSFKNRNNSANLQRKNAVNFFLIKWSIFFALKQ